MALSSTMMEKKPWWRQVQASRHHGSKSSHNEKKIQWQGAEVLVVMALRSTMFQNTIMMTRNQAPHCHGPRIYNVGKKNHYDEELSYLLSWPLDLHRWKKQSWQWWVQLVVIVASEAHVMKKNTMMTNLVHRCYDFRSSCGEKKIRALGFAVLGFGSSRLKNIVGLWKLMQWKKKHKREFTL